MISPTFFECPNCKDFSAQIREACSKCGYPNTGHSSGIDEPSANNDYAATSDPNPKQTPRTKKKPYLTFAILWFSGGLVCFLIAGLLTRLESTAVIENCRIAEIENYKFPTADYVSLDEHFPLFTAGIITADNQAEIDAGRIRRFVYPVYSSELYAKAMGENGEGLTLKKRTELLNEFSVLLLTDRYKNRKQLPLTAKIQPAVVGRIIKPWGEDIDPTLSDLKKYFKTKNFSETIIIDTTQLPGERDPMLPIILQAFGLLGILISILYTLIGSLQRIVGIFKG